MTLLHRKRVIKVKLEGTKGTKEAADQALLVEDLEIHPEAEFAPRNGAGTHLGHGFAGSLSGFTGTCSFKVEMRGNGSGTDLEAGIKILLQSGGLKNNSDTYKPCSVVADQKTISIDVWEDGKKKGLAGAMGKLKIEAETGKKAYLVCEYQGLWQAPVDDTLPAFSPASSTPLRLAGGTFTVGGSAKKISKLELDFGAQVVAQPDPNDASRAAGFKTGIASFIVTDFDPTVSFDPEADLVATYDLEGIWAAAATFAISAILTDGTDKITISIPKAQYKEVPEAEREGITVHEVVCQCVNDNGDDAFSIKGK